MYVSCPKRWHLLSCREGCPLSLNDQVTTAVCCVETPQYLQALCFKASIPKCGLCFVVFSQWMKARVCVLCSSLICCMLRDNRHLLSYLVWEMEQKHRSMQKHPELHSCGAGTEKVRLVTVPWKLNAFAAFSTQVFSARRSGQRSQNVTCNKSFTGGVPSKVCSIVLCQHPRFVREAMSMHRVIVSSTSFKCLWRIPENFHFRWCQCLSGPQFLGSFHINVLDNGQCKTWETKSVAVSSKGKMWWHRMS